MWMLHGSCARCHGAVNWSFLMHSCTHTGRPKYGRPRKTCANCTCCCVGVVEEDQHKDDDEHLEQVESKIIVYLGGSTT